MESTFSQIATEPRMNQFYYFVFGLCVLVSTTFGCTIDLIPGARSVDKDSHEPYEQKVYYSDVVVFGKAGRSVSGNYPLEQYEGIYTVEFEVLCSYKGGDIPSTIYIAGMGNLNDTIPECPRVPVHFESQYYQVMFLRRTRDPRVFEAEFKANEEESTNFNMVLEDLVLSCGLNLSKTISIEYCEMFTPSEECKQYTPPEFTVPTLPNTSTVKPTSPSTSSTTVSTSLKPDSTTTIAAISETETPPVNTSQTSSTSFTPPTTDSTSSVTTEQTTTKPQDEQTIKYSVSSKGAENMNNTNEEPENQSNEPVAKTSHDENEESSPGSACSTRTSGILHALSVIIVFICFLS